VGRASKGDNIWRAGRVRGIGIGWVKEDIGTGEIIENIIEANKVSSSHPWLLLHNSANTGGGNGWIVVDSADRLVVNAGFEASGGRAHYTYRRSEVILAREGVRYGV